MRYLEAALLLLCQRRWTMGQVWQSRVGVSLASEHSNFNELSDVSEVTDMFEIFFPTQKYLKVNYV